MEERHSGRYKLSRYFRDGVDPGDLTFELVAGGITVSGAVTDISTTGAGLAADGIDCSALESLNTTDTFFLKLTAGTELIVSEIHITWLVPKNDEGICSVRCGARFLMISPGDVLRLADIVERVRT